MRKIWILLFLLLFAVLLILIGIYMMYGLAITFVAAGIGVLIISLALYRIVILS